MRKQLSLMGALALSIGLNAQNQISTEAVSFKPKNLIDAGTWAPYEQSASKVSNIAVTIGSGGNAYGIMFDNKNYLNINPDLDIVAMVHRSNPAVTQDVSSGSLRYGFSSNGGTSFSQNQGPVWNPTASTLFARYPQSVIFNPTGNTNPSNAYIAFYAPILTGTNGGWGGIVVGSVRADGTNLDTATFVTGTTPNFMITVPNDMTVNHATGKVYGIGEMRNETIFQDTLILTVGTWNSSANKFDWVNQNIHCPVGKNADNNGVLADAKIAFSPDGQTGYIACVAYSGDTTTAPAPTYQLMVFKTTNGGTTWTGPTSINMNTLPMLNGSGTLASNLSAWGTGLGWTITDVSTAFQCDIVVDKNNNPHIVVNACPAGSTTTTTSGGGNAFSIFSGLNLIVDVYSNNGGTTYGAFLLDTADFFRGSYGAGADLSEDNRVQATRTADGEYVLFTFGETDFSIWGNPTEGNIFPDVIARGMKIDATPQLYDVVNLSDQDINFKGAAHQHCLADLMFDESNNFRLIVPVAVQSYLNGDVKNDLDPVTYHYLPFVYDLLPSSVNEIEEATNISNIFPNPANQGDAINVVVDNKRAANLSIEVSDLTGRVVYNQNIGFIGTGKHRFEIGTQNLRSGMYLVSVMNGNEKTTKRLIVR